MNHDMYVYNELADEAARKASIEFSNSTTIKEDAISKYQPAESPCGWRPSMQACGLRTIIQTSTKVKVIRYYVIRG